MQVAAVLLASCAFGLIVVATFWSWDLAAEVIGLSLHQGPEECRFALLIAGTLRRVNLNADRHLLQPLIQANCKVDVFFSLFAGTNEGWRKASDAFEQDPDFEGLNRSGIEHLIKRRFSMHGSRVVSSRIFEEHDKEPQDIAFIDRNTFWTDKKGGRGETARTNFLMMWKELEQLWYLAQSQEHQHGPYSFVMILRDDNYWFQDFNLTKLLDIGGELREVGNGNGHLYSMLCGLDTKQGGDTSGLIDYVFLMDRAAAEVLCKAYSRLVWPALFGQEWFRKYENNNLGGSSEHFYLNLVQHSGIQVIEVPLYLMPMQRVGRLKGKMCLHKYCDAKIVSKNIPLFHPDMPLCKEEGF